jgi:hypothetical protein
MGFFQSIGNFFSNFFTKAPQAVDDAFTKANGVVNVIKSVEGSVPGQMVQSLIDLVFPGIGPAIFTGLNTVLADFGTIDSAVTGTAAEISATGLTAINKLQGDSKTLALSNVASIIGHTASTATGGNSTLQQAIAVNQIIHDPNVLNVAEPGIVNAPVGTVLPDGNVVLPNAPTT